MKVNLVYDVCDKPDFKTGIILAIQHVFGMFGATILVPIITGYPISVALFASGLGTIIYGLVTKFKVPVYLGSSFAYISAVLIAVKQMGGSFDAAQTGLFLVGFIYVIVALLIKFIGVDFINKLLPPIVIGPMIAVIGLGLASNAISNAGLVVDGDIKNIFVAFITFIVCSFISVKAKGFIKIVPFLCAIVIGYIVSIGVGIVDFSAVNVILDNGNFIGFPEFILPFKFGNFNHFNLYFGIETLAILPVTIVTIAEHIGDHSVLGKICDKNFIKEPGLDKTLIGDGLATSISALLGGPANTTYGENTGIIGVTRVASIYVIIGAALIAICLSFLPIVSAVITTIPNAVLGGMSIVLYGVIASNGLRVLIDNKVDFSNSKNLIIASAMLVIGLGGALLPIGGLVTLSGSALAAIVGVILNLIL